MTLSEYIYEVNETSFEIEVVLRSHDAPILVDFWAPWCGPCKVLGPLLERLTVEAGGTFRLAKVDVDQNPNLAIRFGVQGIPSVKAFQNGEIKGQFTGAQSEQMLRRFLTEIVPDEDKRAVQEANSWLITRHWEEAEHAFRAIVDRDETHAEAALGLLQSLLMQGKGSEARLLVDVFPHSNQWAQAERLKPLVRLLEQIDSVEMAMDSDPLLPQYLQAGRLIARGNIPAALDGLIDILRTDKKYRRGEAKEVLLSLFSLLGDDDPLTRQYRDELASILF